MADQDSTPTKVDIAKRVAWHNNLSARLLVLTIVFVMLAEVLIWTPSAARYRKDFMEDYIDRAYLSMLALGNLPNAEANAALEMKLLDQAEARAIIVQTAERKSLMLGGDMPPKVDLTVDIRKGSFWSWVMGAFDTLMQTENRVIRTIGMPPRSPDVTVEVLFDEQILRDSLLDFSVRILNLSIVISLFTATLVYLSLQWLIVRPIRHMTRDMISFRENPEDTGRIAPASARGDEIGVARCELHELQKDVQASLRQKGRLAALGAGMAKINHDLRNTLATAVLVSDRLKLIEDAEVKKVTPRLMRAIDRAIELCSQTLNYASDDSLILRHSRFDIFGLVDEVRMELEPSGDDHDITWLIDIDKELEFWADRRQMNRAIHNLCANAIQAGATELKISFKRDEAHNRLIIADNGPGLPEKSKENLFKPFAGSSRKGGTGLGLVIVRDVISAHGGKVELLKTDETGTRFQISIPRQHPTLQQDTANLA
jgi:signal transduction histidine kinase